MELCLLTSRSDDVQSLRLESVPWSPLDFIRGFSPDGTLGASAVAWRRPQMFHA